MMEQPLMELDRQTRTASSGRKSRLRVGADGGDGRPALGTSRFISQGAVVVAAGLIAVTALGVLVRAMVDRGTGVIETADRLLGGPEGEWLFAVVTSLLLVALLVWLGGRVFARR